ncbi:MAG: hypothetical protein FJ399_16780, partial [Verrucomicrobia bacterium]|nr:hypothetical protein [Verrucomicrobiota bacterium]
AAAFLTAPQATAQLINTSVRVRVGTGADILITGFVVGATPKTFLFRAVGPGLAAFGVPDTLADPTLSLYSGSTVLQSNDDWGSASSPAAITQAGAAAGAFALAAGSRDSALIATLQPGSYTVQISGVGGGTGVALFEAYEIVPPVVTTSGTLRGAVRDGATNSGISGVSLTFTSSTGASLGSVTTGSSGEYSISLPAGVVTANVSVTGYVSTTLTATVVANTTTQADNVLFAQNVAGTGTISGRITNALTGAGLSGATLRLRAGANNSTGTIVTSGSSGGSGDYTLTASSGTYTCEISLSGYVTTTFVCVAVGGRTISNQNASISPVLSGNETRIVLTWGATPSDLDSHLTGPVANSTSRFHVYYAASSTTGVRLDVDDTSSYGPETITISQFLSGVYRYSVHDFSNGSSTTSTVMSNQSNAQVRVFQGSAQVATFNVPSGQTGNLWTVFEMDGSTRTITPVNRISNISDASAVPSLHEGVVLPPDETDAALLTRLPPKK